MNMGSWILSSQGIGRKNRWKRRVNCRGKGGKWKVALSFILIFGFFWGGFGGIGGGIKKIIYQ